MTMELSIDEARLKKLHMRSWRRGMKEMDLILGPFADAHLASLGTKDLDDYELMLDENDQDLYLWVTGAVPCPPQLFALLDMIALKTGVRPEKAKPAD